MNDDAAMREALFSAPHDDQARRVYADWLIERGDPLGVFIAAQLRGDDEAAFNVLESAIKATPLPLLGVPTFRAFQRGFLIACVTSGERALSAAEKGDWALIEHLRLANPRAADFITAVGARLTCLQKFETDTGDAVQALLQVRPRPLRQLKVHAMHGWFDLSALVDASTSLTLSVVGVLEVGRDENRVSLSPSRHPFRPELMHQVLAGVVRPDDEIDFFFMGSREVVEAARVALTSIPHQRFTEHQLGFIGPR